MAVFLTIQKSLTVDPASAFVVDVYIDDQTIDPDPFLKALNYAL
jgi:hypothetical protein